MTIIDGVLIGMTFISAVLGFMRGLTREVLSLASWGCSALITYTCWTYAQAIAQQFVENKMMADTTAIVAMFVLLLICFYLISHVLTSVIRDSMLGGLDRSLGFLFGIFRACLIVCGFYISATLFIALEDMPEMIRSSRFIPFIQNSSQAVLSVVPHNITAYISEQQQKVHLKKVNNNPNAGMSSHNGQQVIENGIDALSQKAAEIANNAVQNSVKAAIHERMSEQQIQNAKAYAQQQADNLARLQPKVVAPQAQQMDETGVTAKQEKALDKFLNTTSIDEPTEQVSTPETADAASAQTAASAPTM